MPLKSLLEQYIISDNNIIKRPQTAFLIKGRGAALNLIDWMAHATRSIMGNITPQNLIFNERRNIFAKKMFII